MNEPARLLPSFAPVELVARSHPLERATADEFEASPRGRYVVGRTWAYFSADEGLAGCVLWGAVDAEDIGALLAMVRVTHRRGTRPHVGLLDASAVRSIAPAAFPLARAYVDAHGHELRAVVRRFAIVRPKGFLAAVAEGFFRIVPAPYPVSTFSNVRDALGWLDKPSAMGAVDQLDAILGQERPLPAITPRLREVLVQRLKFISIDDAAVALGLSTRSLQRRLKAEGTTFQRELSRARVEVAQREMRNTHSPLTRIAYEVGCASPAHLTILFQKHVGQAPSRWRGAQRD
jgi:AraC-like DNA-binding protein